VSAGDFVSLGQKLVLEDGVGRSYLSGARGLTIVKFAKEQTKNDVMRRGYRIGDGGWWIFVR
jgi:hypothetical protein